MVEDGGASFGWTVPGFRVQGSRASGFRGFRVQGRQGLRLQRLYHKVRAPLDDVSTGMWWC